VSFIVDHVTVRFQGRIALDDVSAALDERRIAVIGDNGSGKSTFARVLNGLILPDEGRVLVDGRDTLTMGDKIRAHVGFCFQNPDTQLVMPTVAEDLALGLKPLKLAPADIEQRVEDTLDRFEIAHLAQRSVHMLSGGEKQLVALAGVMITAPDTVICDEPTTLLDRRNAANVLAVLKDLACRVILVTHDLGQIADFDRAVWFHDGLIAADGSPSEVAAAYEKSLSGIRA
jgi:biotin transport system ATP-binding protein